MSKRLCPKAGGSSHRWFRHRKRRGLHYLGKQPTAAEDSHFTLNLLIAKEKMKNWHTHWSGHFSPLEYHVFRYASIGINVHSFVLIAHKHLHSIRFGQDDNGVRCDIALNLCTEQNPPKSALNQVYRTKKDQHSSAFANFSQKTVKPMFATNP